jgi:hypothetical protein
MSQTKNAVEIISCSCGRVSLEALGSPIVETVCHCASCQKAGKQLETLPNAASILDATDGTPFVLYRKDKVRCLKGDTLLGEHRLNATTSTRRVVATCCNTAMFLDFTKGHWISIYGTRLPDHDGKIVSNKSGFFVPKLVWAWLQMGFRTPKIDYVKGTINHVKT